MPINAFESIPPDKNAPRGTSAKLCLLTALFKESSMHKIASDSLEIGFFTDN